MVRIFTFTTATATAAAVVAVTTLQSVEAHSNMMSPTPQWPSGYFQQNWPYARLDSTAFNGPGSEIPGKQGVKKIAALMGTSTVRDFVTKHAKITIPGATMDCGKTELTGKPYDIPAEVDFPWFHQGPCEAWCDDTKIFFNENCRDNKVGKLKIDQSLCANAKRLQVMYVGVHLENYEIYSNCIPLTGVAAAPGAASPSPAQPHGLGGYGVHGALPNGRLSSILQRRAVLPGLGGGLGGLGGYGGLGGLGGLGGFGLLNPSVPTTPTLTPAPTPTKCKYPLRVETPTPRVAPAVVPPPVPAPIGATPGKQSSPIQQSPVQLAVQREGVNTPSQRAEIVRGPATIGPVYAAPVATTVTSKNSLRGDAANVPSQY